MSVVPAPVRVLLVDHDGSSADRLRSALPSRFACEVAPSGESALAFFESEPFDVVVANDDHIGGMTGLELLDSIVKQSPTTPVILVGDPQIARAMEAGKRGAYDYLVR